MNKFLLILSFLIICFCISYGEKTPPVPKSKPIELHRADVLNGSTPNGTQIYQGNVWFSQGDVDIKCDMASRYIITNRAELTGNVVITQGKMTMKAPKINYDGNSGLADAFGGVEIIDSASKLTSRNCTYSTKTLIADFTGNVIVDSDTSIIYANHLIYNRNNKNSFAYGKVIIRGKYNNTILTGDTVLHYPSKNYSFATGKPVLFQIDSSEDIRHKTQDTRQELEDSIQNSEEDARQKTEDARQQSTDNRQPANDTIQNSEFRIQNSEDSLHGKSSMIKYDTLSASCDTMEMFRSEIDDKYIFRNNVEMTKGNIAAKAKMAIYNRRAEFIELFGLPIVWHDSTELFADSTVIYLRNNRLKLLDAHGNAFAGTRDDTINLDRISQITGKTIRLEFSGDTLTSLTGCGDAKSLYFMAGEEGSDGTARNSCDTLIVRFDGKEADSIIWLGGVQGEYFPENLVEGKVKDYFLPGYRWSDSKPKKKILIMK
jgi:lipopolysaccharide export system protein LptA